MNYPNIKGDRIIPLYTNCQNQDYKENVDENVSSVKKVLGENWKQDPEELLRSIRK